MSTALRGGEGGLLLSNGIICVSNVIVSDYGPSAGPSLVKAPGNLLDPQVLDTWSEPDVFASGASMLGYISKRICSLSFIFRDNRSILLVLLQTFSSRITNVS